MICLKPIKRSLCNQQVQLFNESSIPLYKYFNSYAQRFGVMERKLFVDLYIHKKPSNSLKTLYCSKYHLTSRQYNSIKKQLDGRVISIQESTLLYIEDIQAKIEKTKSVIERKIEQKGPAHLLPARSTERHGFQELRS